jgi:hypothetical protein
LPPEAAHAAGESPGAAFAIASKMGIDGQQLSAATREAFASGLGTAMAVGATIAILTAAVTLWRAPRRDSSTAAGGDARELEAGATEGSRHPTLAA